MWFIISTQGMLGCVVEWDVVHYSYSGNVVMCCGVGCGLLLVLREC